MSKSSPPERKPSTSPPSDPGTTKPFNYLRWIDETNTTPVNFAVLTHMFHVNNKHCYGDIYDLRKNHVPSIEECQYMVGCENDAFSVGFFAFHEDNFMQSYHLWYHRRLNGPDITLETGTTNAPASIPPVPATLDSSNAKDSNSKTFAQMLESHDKCAFSIELRVYPKHTNGFGMIWNYGAADTAAVSLEKVKCIPLQSLSAEIAKLVRPI